MTSIPPTVRIFPCGCRNAWHPAWEMWHCEAKCAAHSAAEARNTGLQYYRHLGAFTDGRIAECYAREMNEALEAMGLPEMPRLIGPGRALEVGAGPGVYGPWLRARYYHAAVVEPDAEACAYASAAGAEVFCGTWEEYAATPHPQNDLIVAAHVVEHMRPGPAAFPQFLAHLKPGGVLLVIVPDDEDLLNPGHLWFFNPPALGNALRAAGFTDVRQWAARRIPREMFLYAYARRPA